MKITPPPYFSPCQALSLGGCPWKYAFSLNYIPAYKLFSSLITWSSIISSTLQHGDYTKLLSQVSTVSNFYPENLHSSDVSLWYQQPVNVNG